MGKDMNAGSVNVQSRMVTVINILKCLGYLALSFVCLFVWLILAVVAVLAVVGGLERFWEMLRLLAILTGIAYAAYGVMIVLVGGSIPLGELDPSNKWWGKPFAQLYRLLPFGRSRSRN